MTRGRIRRLFRQETNQTDSNTLTRVSPDKSDIMIQSVRYAVSMKLLSVGDDVVITQSRNPDGVDSDVRKTENRFLFGF